MGRLQGGHARWLNERLASEGHVFRHRFWSRRLEDDGALLRACLYVVLNPVSAGMCRHPEDWPWCSYRTTAHGDSSAYAPGEERLLGLFGDTPREARQCYARVVTELAENIRGVRIGGDASLWSVLGEVEAPRRAQVPG
jgi:hypothetical protein